jgi:hypothetical protein
MVALIKSRNMLPGIVNKSNLFTNKVVLQYEKVSVKYGTTLENKGSHIFQRPRSHLKVPGAQKSGLKQQRLRMHQY